ncbi:MAG TPA: HAMP domain-containing sensor histidine kinase [Actinophytocola sp.]|uniref:sensor histidine kinase n=1 Tax=Actinophytocola sp. TaxID=1872138 RepID=UPI002F91D366
MSGFATGPAPTDRDAALLGRATRRLGLQIALAVALIVVVLSGLAVIVVVQGQHRAAVTLLEQAVARADDVTDPPAGVWLVAQGPKGRIATPGLPTGLPDEASLTAVHRTGAATTGEYLAHGTEYAVYTARRGSITVQAALDLTANHDQRDRLAFALLGCGAVGLVLAAAAGVWLSRRAVRPLATALAMQRRFVSDASHELRTPLTLLSTRVQMLRRHLGRGAAPDEVAREADGVVDDARHLTAILEDLLRSADPDDNNDTTFDFAELAGQVTAAYRTASAEAGVTLTVHRPGTAVVVRGSPTAAHRAVTALLDNAIRHATSAVTVAVAADPATRHAVLDVTDDGAGIDPAVLPRIFDRFATTREQQNTASRRRYGLGLALVSDIAARLGGDVSGADAPGGGARLRMTLPLEDEAPGEPLQDFSQTRPPPSPG